MSEEYTVFFSPTLAFFLCLGINLTSGVVGPSVILTRTLFGKITSCQKKNQPYHQLKTDHFSLTKAQWRGAIGSIIFLFAVQMESHSRDTTA